jgi:hypothetical protein
MCRWSVATAGKICRGSCRLDRRYQQGTERMGGLPVAGADGSDRAVSICA